MALTRKVENILWSIAVFIPISLVSLGYILFKREFAKLHLEFSSLNFPIFVGEILLSYCVLLLICWWIKNPPGWGRFYFFAFVYLIWFVIKTGTGYWTWGPLALRHAALFYYPFFFMIGYVFFNRQVFTKWSLLGLFCGIEGIFLLINYDHYWVFTLGCLGLISILGIKDKKFAWPMLFLLVISIPYLAMFKTARMMFVANTASFLLLAAAILCFLEAKLYIKVLILALIGLGVSLGFYKSYVLGESTRMFTPPQEVLDQFVQMDKTVQGRKASFQLIPRKAGLYNTEYGKINISFHNSELHWSKNNDVRIKNESSYTGAILLKQDKYLKEWHSVDNIIFRFFIWRDMWEEWKSKKPLWGFAFGKPLRSPSLEMLHWAEAEWARDGWIEPHNSYFNIFYRAGIVGIILVALIWGALVWLIKLAFERRSWILILFAAILLNWMVAANFLLILELPYTAIPFWTLAGLAFAYACPDTDKPKAFNENPDRA